MPTHMESTLSPDHVPDRNAAAAALLGPSNRPRSRAAQPTGEAAHLLVPDASVCIRGLTVLWRGCLDVTATRGSLRELARMLGTIVYVLPTATAAVEPLVPTHRRAIFWTDGSWDWFANPRYAHVDPAPAAVDLESLT